MGCVPVHNAGACETHAGWGQHACGQVRPPRLPSHSHPFANRAFSPLTGFMDEENYAHVVEHMRLKARSKLQSLCLSPHCSLRFALTSPSRQPRGCVFFIHPAGQQPAVWLAHRAGHQQRVPAPWPERARHSLLPMRAVILLLTPWPHPYPHHNRCCSHTRASRWLCWPSAASTSPTSRRRRSCATAPAALSTRVCP